jgi:hypothetical protein
MNFFLRTNWLAPETLVVSLCLSLALRFWFLAGLILGYLAGRHLPRPPLHGVPTVEVESR